MTLTALSTVVTKIFDKYHRLMDNLNVILGIFDTTNIENFSNLGDNLNVISAI